MVATADIRFKRMKREYDTLHDTQDETLDKVDGIEAAILGLNQAVTANQERNEQQFAEIQAMLQAIIKDQNVPYKPTMGFMKDE